MSDSKYDFSVEYVYKGPSKDKFKRVEYFSLPYDPCDNFEVVIRSGWKNVKTGKFIKEKKACLMCGRSKKRGGL